MTRPLPGLTRRHFISGSASMLLLAACADDEDTTSSTPSGGSEPIGASPSATPTNGPWTYTDDLGETITLDRRPQRIVAYSSSAAVLWDFGIEALGTMGPLTSADGTPGASAGRVDVTKVTSVGDESVDLEKLAALRPDIIVLQKNSTGLDSYPLEDAQLDSARKIAPFVAVTAYGANADTVLAAYERLAGALGADLGAAELQSDKNRLRAAQDSLKAMLAGKSGLKALFATATTDKYYIAKTKDFPDMLAYAGLGLDIVPGGGSEEYFEELSWENASTYPVDVIFLDERAGNLQPDALAEDFPTWRELPAVKAGQVGAWNAEVVLSPRGFADAVEDLTQVIADVNPATVS